MPDITCRNCGAKVSDQYGYCTSCLTPFADWISSPLDSTRPLRGLQEAQEEHGDPDNLLAQAKRLWVNGEKELALEALTMAVRLDSSRADIWYEKAKYECRRGVLAEAIISLEAACSIDGLYVTLAEFSDSEFIPLRASPRFQKLVKRREEELSRPPSRPPHIAIQNPESRRCSECGAKLGHENRFCPNCDAYQP